MVIFYLIVDEEDNVKYNIIYNYLIIINNLINNHNVIINLFEREFDI